MAASRLPGQTGNIAGFSSLGFGVGVRNFLDSEESRVRSYWRGLEEGSEKFIGRTIYGLFGNAHGPRGALQTGQLSGFGAGSGQKFVPFLKPPSDPRGGRLASAYLYRQGDFRQGRGEGSRLRTRGVKGGGSALLYGGGTHGVINKPIVAQHAYLLALEEFGAVAKEEEAITAAFRASSSSSHLRDRFPRPMTPGGVAFSARTGLRASISLSGFNTSILSDQAFTTELTNANKALAFALASKVYEIQKRLFLRPDVSSGRLEAATLDPRNRFPSTVNTVPLDG